MALFIVKVECEGQEWYKQFGTSNRINDKQIAQKMSKGEAESIAEYYKQFCNAKVTIIPVDKE